MRIHFYFRGKNGNEYFYVVMFKILLFIFTWPVCYVLCILLLYSFHYDFRGFFLFFWPWIYIFHYNATILSIGARDIKHIPMYNNKMQPKRFSHGTTIVTYYYTDFYYGIEHAHKYLLHFFCIFVHIYQKKFNNKRQKYAIVTFFFLLT